ncbi:MAG: DNA polymerase/3'-5' exonuclease PolX [Bacteroidia bacterium]|nr:DNA polymerase/3'-5' exonuclease PolX [Bacteroidia bacterium]
MSSDEIIEHLELMARLMELHEENPFKIRAVSNAAFKLNKLRYNFEGKSKEDIENIEGIGKGISSKIIDLISTNETPELNDLLKKTPPGIIEVLNIKGLGPKKVRQLWKELDIESVGELLYACNENRLTTLKGFGEKTQNQVKQNIEFSLSNQNKYHYAALEQVMFDFLELLKEKEPGLQVALCGEMARKCEVIEKLELLIDRDLKHDYTAVLKGIPLQVEFKTCRPEEFYYYKVLYTSSAGHLEKTNLKALTKKTFGSEEEVYSALHLQYIVPELREGLAEVSLAKDNRLPELITIEDLKGILHCHSTYSDGVHSLKEMAGECQRLGYGYFGICDHSRSAGYAQGLSIERVQEQHAEIDRLNSGYSGFKILKGIESDILNDGSLDYPDEVLKTFDFVVASVHSNLKMNEAKATERLIKAIENPYTSILGHPSGRLLLARAGYPLDYKKIIDACAANKVSVELNAHPYRLDLDWRWIPYCLEKNVMISINPDAHNKDGLKDVYYGICAARKGMLSKKYCLNALDVNEIMSKFRK